MVRYLILCQLCQAVKLLADTMGMQTSVISTDTLWLLNEVHDGIQDIDFNLN